MTLYALKYGGRYVQYEHGTVRLVSPNEKFLVFFSAEDALSFFDGNRGVFESRRWRPSVVPFELNEPHACVPKGMLDGPARQNLLDKIENESFVYCFTDYSHWNEIQDDQFHVLRKQMLDSINALAAYIGVDSDG